MVAARTQSLVALAVLAAAGCATVPEHDPIVDDARVAVYAARQDAQVVTYAPAELDRAVLALRDTDDLIARGGTLDEVHRLARLAQQDAALAQQTARARSAEAALAVQRAAQNAQAQADLSRQQAEAAQAQAAAAQRQAEAAQRQAAAIQQQAQAGQVEALTQQQLADLAAHPTSRGVVVTLNDTMFDPGRAELLPSASYSLQRLATYLGAHPERTIAIEGYTDSSGDPAVDRRVSEQRALAVQAALVSLGVDPRRIVVRGYGPAYPIASNSTDAGRQMNRRVEIVISDRGGVVPPRA